MRPGWQATVPSQPILPVASAQPETTSASLLTLVTAAGASPTAGHRGPSLGHLIAQVVRAAPHRGRVASTDQLDQADTVKGPQLPDEPAGGGTLQQRLGELGVREPGRGAARSRRAWAVPVLVVPQGGEGQLA
jgi:hypothetical protein